MANKKPLVLYEGMVEELHPDDLLIGGVDYSLIYTKIEIDALLGTIDAALTEILGVV